MKLFVFLWINSGLKQRKEYVFQHLGKIRYQLLRLEYITETNKQKKSLLIFCRKFPNIIRNIFTCEACMSVALTIFWEFESSTSCYESALCAE